LEPILDNYGFVNIACGGNPYNPNRGIRMYEKNPMGHVNNPMTDYPPATPFNSMRMRLSNVNAGVAFITPFEGH
jgi:hypothetical protein